MHGAWSLLCKTLRTKSELGNLDRNGLPGIPKLKNSAVSIKQSILHQLLAVNKSDGLSASALHSPGQVDPSNIPD